jgi:rfaE bifunctional protein kinase chain/domain
VRTDVTPGAAGTIANNLVALGARSVDVISVIGRDGFGWELLRALEQRRIANDLLVVSSDVCTFTYTKLLNVENEDEDRPRVDFINTEPLSAAVEANVIERLDRVVAAADVVVVSDQAETAAGGVITAQVRERINELPRLHPDKVFWVDSRKRAELFRRVVLKPNEDEAAAACRRAFGAVDLPRLRTSGSLRSLIVTYGARGAEVFNESGSYWVNGRAVKAADICGAGDSFSAGASCALALTGSDVEAAAFGNLVASITVMKKGTGTASPEELLAALRDQRP